MLAHQKSSRPKNHRDNFNITAMYRILGHTYCSSNCIDSKVLQSIKLSNMPRNVQRKLTGDDVTDSWTKCQFQLEPVENGPSGRWGISTNAQTEENAHISSPPTFLLIKVKVKSYEKILKKWMPVGRCQDDFDNEQ